jgi:hypothetical protein
MAGLKLPVPLHFRQLVPHTMPELLHVKQGFAGRSKRPLPSQPLQVPSCWPVP